LWSAQQFLELSLATLAEDESVKLWQKSGDIKYLVAEIHESFSINSLFLEAPK